MLFNRCSKSTFPFLNLIDLSLILKKAQNARTGMVLSWERDDRVSWCDTVPPQAAEVPCPSTAPAQHQDGFCCIICLASCVLILQFQEGPGGRAWC